MPSLSAHPRVTLDPNVKFGKPVIAGTRIHVELLLKLLGKGHSVDALLSAYPQLTREDVLAAQDYAADHLPRVPCVAAE